MMNKPSVLIVEDDPDVAQLYESVLTSGGCTTKISQTGEAAVAWLALNVPDAVVLDLNLPSQVSGIEVLQQIRSDARLANTRVIVVTGHPDLIDNVRGQADLILTKPVDVNQISDFVAQLRLHR
jgi:DNA-binding response OmpR family regulator